MRIFFKSSKEDLVRLKILDIQNGKHFAGQYPGGGGVLPYQNGGGVPPEPHGAYGEREKSRNLTSPNENYSTIYLISISIR